jgi:hypothetical protein
LKREREGEREDDGQTELEERAV